MTPTPHEIYLEARRLGLSLEIYGDKLRVKGKYCPPEFEAILREHKQAILQWLAAPKDQLALGKYPEGEFDDVMQSYPSGDRTGVPPGDEAALADWYARHLPNHPKAKGAGNGHPRHRADTVSPWLHIARQVNCGEWDGADDSTRQSLTIGLRSLVHPSAKAALERLRLEKGNL